MIGVRSLYLHTDNKNMGEGMNNAPPTGFFTHYKIGM